MGDMKVGGVLLVVFFASRTVESASKINDLVTHYKSFAPVPTITVKIASTDNFLTQVHEADIIHFRGGSTDTLITTLRRFPNLKEQFKGKVIAGSSAGAYALSTLYSSHYDNVAATGLGIAPFHIVTHYASTTMPPLPGAIEALRAIRTELELIILKEGEWKRLNQP